MAKLTSSSDCHFWSPRFIFWMPCGRFLTVGSWLILDHTSPLTTPGARSAPTASRRTWFERWIAVGPDPKPMSATAFYGTEPPEEVGTGKFSSVEMSRRAFSDSETVIGTWRSASEHFAL